MPFEKGAFRPLGRIARAVKKYVFNVYLGGQLVHFNIPIRGTVSLGRSQSNAILLPDATIGLQHLSLEVCVCETKQRIVVRDHGGPGGTFVNDEPIEEREVAAGDLIKAGPYVIEICELYKNHVPQLRDDPSQTVVFAGDPFSDQGSAAARLQALHDLSMSLPDLPTPVLLERAALTVQRGLKYSHLCVLLNGQEELLSCTTWNAKGPCNRDEMPVSRTLISRCLATGNAVISENVRLDRRFSKSQSLRLQGVASALCVPLRAHEQQLGLIYCTRREPGNPFNHEDLQYLMVVASQIAVCLGHQRTINRLKSSARTLSSILDHLRHGILVCDADFNVLCANSPAREILGHRRIIGLPVSSVLSDYQHNFDEVRMSGATEFQVCLPSEEEQAQRFIAAIHPLPDQYHADWSCLITFHDDSERREAEHAKIAFVNQLAHKLRTPLTVFLGVLSLLEEQLGVTSNKEIDWLLRTGGDSCDEMTRIIERFMSFASINLHDGLEPRDEFYLDLQTLVDQAIDHARNLPSVQDLRISVDLCNSAYEVRIDNEQIVQCFTQIIENAGKFAGKGAHLVVTSALGESGELQVRFADDGVGIPTEEQELVFAPFHQIDPDNTGQIPGMGLGLWWAREVLRAHGGDVELRSAADGESAENPGTEIFITIPARRVVDSVVERQSNDDTIHELSDT